MKWERKKISGTWVIARFSLGLLLSSGAGRAAEIVLEDRGRITGELVTISGEGVVSVRSDLLPDLLQVVDEKVRTIRFDVGDSQIQAPVTSITLLNGDVLPYDEISLDGSEVSLRSESLGQLEFGKEIVHSIGGEEYEMPVLYAHPRTSVGWYMGSTDREHWRFREKQFVSTGKGFIARPMKFDGPYGLEMLVSWEDEPNFEISFAAQLKGSAGGDRYAIQYNEDGLELSRHVEGEGQGMQLVHLDRDPSRYPGETFEIAVRVDPGRKLIELYLDGELEAKVIDPLDEVPRGEAIRFENLSDSGTEFRVRDLRGLQWEPGRDRFRGKKVYVGMADQLIDRFGERYEGDLLGIGDVEGVMEVRFRDREGGVEFGIPMSEVSALYFRQGEGGKREASGGKMKLRFVGGGELRVDSCVFDDTNVVAVHPLMGKVVLSREGLYEMRREGFEEGEGD